MRRALQTMAVFLFGAWALLTPAVAEDRFIDALGDVPLMEGFRVDADSIVDFDTPQGRIVRLSARGAADGAAVEAFYARTLPNLGWRPQQDGYIREGEALALDIERTAGETIIRYSLAPARQENE